MTEAFWRPDRHTTLLRIRVPSGRGAGKTTGRCSCEAEPLYLRTLEIQEAALPEDHRDLAFTRVSLGPVYGMLGRPEEGEAVTRRAVDIKKTVYGPSHLEVGNALGNLAMFVSMQGRQAEAEQIFLQSPVLR